MSDHPAAFRLDALAAGDDDAIAREHVESCERCKAYVEAMQREARAFASNADGDAFARRVQARANEAEKASRARLVRILYVAAPALAAAALLVLVLRPAPRPGVPEAMPTFGTSSVRFKGKVQVAVVRERDGAQQRFATELSVRPGDRVRIEVAVDDARPVVAGVLGKDGSWLTLLAPALLEAGTHFSEQAARFDDTPTEGWILAGEPDAVERARMTHDFDGIAAIPIVVEPR